MGSSVNSSTLGAGLTGKIAEHVVRAKVSATERLSGHYVKLAMAAQEQFFALTGAEVKGTVGPLWVALADHPDSPEWLRRTADFVGRGHGQWQTLLAGAATGAAMGGGILDLVTNELNPPITALIAQSPNLQLSPAEAAAAAVRGFGRRDHLLFEAARSGIDAERFSILEDLNVTRLAPAEILELYRRGELGRDLATRLLHLTGMDGDSAGRFLSLSRLYVSLADAGQMWNRSIITDDELMAIARVNGYTDTDAHRFAELGGEPPSPDLLYTAYRRGFIDEDRLRRGIVQGPIRNEWFDLLEKMQYRSMTPEQAASAVTQGHLDIARGEAIAKEYGLNPDDFSTIVETSGRPPGIDFAAEAYLRGFVTDAEWSAMFLESAIKNRYLPVLRQMRTRLVPQETARSLYAKGVGDLPWITKVLHDHGFSPDDAQRLIAAATVEKTQATRDLSLTAVRDLYAEQEITPTEAAQMLQQLGYDEQEAAWELALADLARVRTYRNAVITKVRAGYVKGLLTQPDAVTTLDGLKVPSARRDELLSLWDIERDTVTRDLTPAQLVSAARKGLMDPQVAQHRLIGQGYAADDAAVLLGISGVSV